MDLQDRVFVFTKAMANFLPLICQNLLQRNVEIENAIIWVVKLENPEVFIVQRDANQENKICVREELKMFMFAHPLLLTQIMVVQ